MKRFTLTIASGLITSAFAKSRAVNTSEAAAIAAPLPHGFEKSAARDPSTRSGLFFCMIMIVFHREPLRRRVRKIERDWSVEMMK